MMPGVFKIRKQCRGKGMRHEDVLFDPVRVIDMDRAKGDTPATLQQVELVAGMLPGAAILRSNGMQVFFRSSEPWEVEAPMLAALGRHLEFFLYPLFYDDCCHLKLDGTPGNHRNHCYRAPWGSCDQGPVRCWIPETDRLMTVREAFNQLGLDLPAPSVGFVGFSDPEDAEEIPLTVESRKMSTKSTSSRGGSLAPNYEEFDRIRQLLTNLLKQGLSRQEAEAKILAMPWEHHSRDGLKTTLPTVRPKKARPSDSRWLSDGEWATICADLAELPLRLGPCSTKRWLLQKNYSIRATRAWSFEFLFYDDMNCEEAIASFFKWREFEKIRYLSTTAIGEAAVVEDLRNCWNKFNNPDYLSNPYSNLKKVAKKTVDAVYRIAKQLMTFKMADIKNEVHISATQIRAALNELYDEGKVDRTK